LYRKRSSDREFEVHKLGDGNLLLIGFVGADTANELRRDGAQGSVPRTVYSMPWTDAQFGIALPVANLRFRDTRSIQLDGGGYRGVLDLGTN
jgi:hypothetical protein